MLGGLLSSYDINGHDTEEAYQFSETGKLQKEAFSIETARTYSWLGTLWLTLGIFYSYPTAKGLKYLTCILQERPEYISFILQQNVGNILPVAEGLVYFICSL